MTDLMPACPSLPSNIIVATCRAIAQNQVSVMRYIVMCATGFAFADPYHVIKRTIIYFCEFLIRHISAIRYMGDHGLQINWKLNNMKLSINI